MIRLKFAWLASAWLFLFGFVNAHAQVTPSISSQPQSQILHVGATAYFSSSVSPLSPSYKYTWYHDSTPLKTNQTLIVTNLSFADSGRYWLVVSNSTAAVTSKVANLTVVPQAQLRSLASVPVSGFATWIKVRNEHAYLAHGRMSIYDVSDPSQPVRSSIYGGSTSGIYALYPVEPLLYCLEYSQSGGQYLHILDVSNPAIPVLKKKFPLPFVGLDIIVRDGLAYIGGGNTSVDKAGLGIFDVHDPVNPFLLGTDPERSIYTLELLGNTLFTARPYDNPSVGVFDVSDPTHPSLTTRLARKGYTDTVKIAGARLYVAGDSPFSVYDISNPRQPRLLGMPKALIEALPSAPASPAHGMTATGDFLFHGTQNDAESLYLLDLSNPAVSARIGKLPLTGGIEGMDWANDLLFIAHKGAWDIVKWDTPTNAPVAVLQPLDTLAVPGTRAGLAAGASGGEALIWQWFKGNNPIDGQTNRTLLFPSISSADAGTYSAVAKNNIGEVTLGPVALQVVEPAPLNLSLTFSQNVPRVKTSFSAGIQGALEASSNLLEWTALWSGQSDGEPVEIIDSGGGASRERFYRFRYGAQ